MNSVKVQDTKLIYKSSVAFLHANNELSEREIKKAVPFTIASKTIKYLRISFTKELKDLYTDQ